ncbi:MAG: arsenate reductase (glutaredoxin) [Rhodobacteraceae bacterium]|nr:arsenate reductase (glutaredoxin) [Paracoccaceae bacterium]
MAVSDVTIWHNPRCSKSRETLKLLEDRGIEPVIRLYLQDPPTADELRAMRGMLGVETLAMMRVKEAAFKELNLSRDSEDELLIAGMVAQPVLIERPVVIKNGKAAIGRPPENVLAVL